MRKSRQQWINYGKQLNKLLFFYQGKVYNLTSFIYKHPGGKKALANYIYKDITHILFRVYPHDKEKTLYTLKQYIIGSVNDTKSPEKSIRNVSPLKQKNKRVCFQAKDDEQKYKLESTTQTKKVKKGHSKQKSKDTSIKQLIQSGSNSNISTKQNKLSKQKRSQKDSSKSKSKSKKRDKSLIQTSSNIVSNSSIYNLQQTQQHKPILKIPILNVKQFKRF